MAKFDYSAPAELFPSRNRKIKSLLKYRRFDKAADAIRFAMEELPAPVLLGAYIEIDEKDGIEFPDRGRFMAYAARVMRGLIIDHARSRGAQKRGGKFEITSSETALNSPPDPQELTKD